MLQQHYSLFDSFFAPTRVVVVSEERLLQAEMEARQNQVDALDVRIEELTKYRNSLYSEIKSLKPTNEKLGGDLDAMDGGTHDG
jgi:peptidoglycan hydrolase CwlO-like protein